MKHLQWEVPYTPGHIDAHGYNCGVLAATHRIETTAQPAAMFLTADRHILQAGGQDTVPIAVAVVDAAGRVVPTANNRVHFTVTGAGVNAGVGNGDPNCHEPNQANYRSAFNGWCMVLARAGRTGGMIHVRATAAGLKPADVELLVRS
jgi:beta-galactosidase